MLSRSLVMLSWVFVIQLAGIYLFIRGFLLTRLSLTDFANCTDGVSCTLPQTHNRAIVLIIDALRFDFLTPNPPNPPSPFHHNILTLPRDLSASSPQNSLLFNSYADPPTSTLQRIKALTTGSLPTFVDIGSSFAGSSITEDSLLNQLLLANKKMAFMGDDTWMTVFPTAFQPNMSFPYDSFNVEDLHTVDEGVIRHLFPLMMDESKPFDLLIGHFLGVDHVGHRVGPEHPSMKAKLEQMNQVLTRVVDLLHDDTLLVVLGDHGMDRTGDHGGDGELETSAGLWIYSKTRPIAHPDNAIPSALLRYSTFPGTIPSRSVQQIDLVPSLSLLLGLPIPFNNLGTIIPELFWHDNLVRALDLNAAQIKRYLDAYRASVSGGELDEVWPRLQAAWDAIRSDKSPAGERATALQDYTRLALESCRSLWAQFNPALMGLGLVLMGTGFLAIWALYALLLQERNTQMERWFSRNVTWCLLGVIVGAFVGFCCHLVAKSSLPGVDALDCALFGGCLLSCLVFIAPACKSISLQMLRSVPVLLVLHTLAFLSNSFTFWEDRIVTFLLISSIIPYVRVGFTAPTPRLRNRILGFSLLFAICVRLIAISTVCREEQQPYCHVTFFSSSSVPSPPLLVLLLALPVSFCLPRTIERFLRISKSDAGIAKSILPWILTPALLSGCVYWLVEFVEVGVVGDHWLALSRGTRTALARLAMGIPLLGGVLIWWRSPLCLGIDVQTIADKNQTATKQVTVFGYANAYGASYLIFWSLALAIVYATTQLTGQLVLAVGTIAILAHLEIVDSVRDVRNSRESSKVPSPSPASTESIEVPIIRFAEIVPLALLGLHMFYGTGHQAVFSTIQWKSAFLLTPNVTYPFAPLTVIINTFGSLFLVGLAVPLLAFWNRAPPLPVAPKANTGADHGLHSGEDVAPALAALGIMAYFGSLLLGSAVSAAILRRHLMVWKVFAPRFIYGVINLLVVDVSVLFGMGVGAVRVRNKVSGLFGRQPVSI